MQLTLKTRKGSILDVINIGENITVDEFTDYYYKKSGYYPERQKWTVETSRGEALKNGPLSDYVKSNGSLVFKDLGIQISWRLVFVIEYLGPLLIFPIFYYFPKLIYSADKYPAKYYEQQMGFFLVMFHYMKRQFETLFIHRFSHATMPISRLPINCTHYWVLCAIFIGYYLFHPSYHPPWSLNPNTKIISTILASLMVLFEILNFRTHVILRNLRPRGTKKRQIPYGCGFDLVSCANYTYEVAAWISFSLLVNCFTSYFFTLVSFIQTLIWALKKHGNYLKEFPDYPKSRKSMIPFII